MEKDRNNKIFFSNTTREELSSYLKRNILKLNEDSLIEWEITRAKLYNLAMKYLLIQVPSERLFSKAGETISKTRNRLTESKLSKLHFLQSVNQIQWDL